MASYAADWGSVFTRYHTWLLMGGSDITLRYRRSVLGPFWISLAMAAMVLAIGSLYAQVMNQPREAFLSYLGCGLLAWTFLSTMVNESCLIVTEAWHLRSATIPVPILAARMVFRNSVIFLHNAVIVLGMLALLGHRYTAAAVNALAGLGAYLLLGLFVAVTLGPLCARFRDLTSLIGSVMQIMFFLTPIFWVPGASSARPMVVDVNPFYHFIEVLRQPMLGHAPTVTNWTVVAAVSGVMGAVAVISLAACRRKLFLWL